MPFKPPAQQPDFSTLVTSLSNSRLQSTNNALYQTIFFLIQNTSRARDLLVDSIETLDQGLSDVGAASFLTTADESNKFPNASRLMAGTGVEFDDSIDGVRTVNVTGSGGYAPMSTGAEPLEIMSDGAGSVLMVGFSE